MKKFTLYLHKNKINGKVYVGITSREVKDRWRGGKGYHGKAFSADIKKYGWDNFEHVIVQTDLSMEDALKKEQELVAFFDSKKNGYNETKGGDAVGMLGKVQSKTTREKISETSKAKVFTKEHKKHISESKQGVKHHMAKPVYQYDKNGNFIKAWDYMSDAAKTLKISKGNIAQVCIGERKSAGGYVWTYERR